MTQEEVSKKGRVPDYKGDGIAVWANSDKNGKTYLAVKILGGITVNAFELKAEVKSGSQT